MSHEIPQPIPKLQSDVFYPIWTQTEIAEWLSNPSSDGSRHFFAPDRSLAITLVKSLSFGEQVIDIVLSDRYIGLTQGRQIMPDQPEIKVGKRGRFIKFKRG